MAGEFAQQQGATSGLPVRSHGALTLRENNTGISEVSVHCICPASSRLGLTVLQPLSGKNLLPTKVQV